MKIKQRILYMFAFLLALLVLSFGTVAHASSEKRTDSPAAVTYPGINPSTVSLSDADLEDAVGKAIVRYDNVDVDVDKGVVTLSGEVVSDTERLGAIDAARAVAGVRMVEDQMQIKGSGSQSAGAYIDDAVVTASVKKKILETKGLSSLKISVDTHNGIVTLTGSADSQELVEQAGRVTKQVNGVKQVENKLLVQPRN